MLIWFDRDKWFVMHGNTKIFVLRSSNGLLQSIKTGVRMPLVLSFNTVIYLNLMVFKWRLLLFTQSLTLSIPCSYDPERSRMSSAKLMVLPLQCDPCTESLMNKRDPIKNGLRNSMQIHTSLASCRFCRDYSELWIGFLNNKNMYFI